MKPSKKIEKFYDILFKRRFTARLAQIFSRVGPFGTELIITIKLQIIWDLDFSISQLRSIEFILFIFIMILFNKIKTFALWS